RRLKNVMSCLMPSSKTENSDGSRSVMYLCAPSITVTFSDTTSMPARKAGACCGGLSAPVACEPPAVLLLIGSDAMMNTRSETVNRFTYSLACERFQIALEAISRVRLYHERQLP